MQSLGLLLHDVARLLKGEFEKRARITQLSLTQWRAMAVLKHHDGITQSALGGKIEASPMTVSDVVERLEGLGYVRREADPADGRAKLVWLTEAAQPVVAEMREVAVDVYARALEGITDDEREVLIRALTIISNNLGGRAAEEKDGAA